MGKIVVLAEKPSVGRDIAKVLKCNINKNSHIEGKDYIVTWGLGHLITLADPELYDDKYKKWSMDTLPMLPNRMKLIVIGKTAKHFNEVKKVLNREDVDKVIIATDPGREGELVARWIIEKSGVKKPMQRLWISSQTDKAIREGFNKLVDSKKYDNLYRAALCRAEADWLVGLNVTRALTCKYNAQLSGGRVQTPTLGMIVNREEEIKNFKPRNYYTIVASSNSFKLQWTNKNGEVRVYDEKKAKDILNKINNKNGKVIDVTKSDKKEFAPKLYDLTELQRDANRIFGFSAKETLSLMQRLYENHKVLTYPRTDSRYISTDIFETIKDRLKAVSVSPYSKFTAEILRGNIKSSKSFVDNTKLSDHHAIIPTEQSVNLSHLSSDERKIFDLVVKRFFANLMPPFEYVQTTVKVEVEGEILTSKGKIVKSKGFKALYERNEEETFANDDNLKDQTLPDINVGEIIKINNAAVNTLQTKPPARFNEATLLSAMESPHKYVNVDKVDAKTLGETGGLGTVATRADIIEKLYSSFCIEKNGKDIVPTSKGKQLIELVPEDLKSPILTAKWEQQLEAIATGKLYSKDFINNMREYATSLVDDVKGSVDKFKHDNLSGVKCTKCGKYMLEVKGKNGRMLVCQDRECGERQNLSRTTNARCPECKKRLELRGQGEGQIYVCTGATCNFREKASVFNKRFDKSDKVNKKEVNNIMKKMKKEAEEDFNNPFAELLKNFK